MAKRGNIFLPAAVLTCLSYFFAPASFSFLSPARPAIEQAIKSQQTTGAYLVAGPALLRDTPARGRPSATTMEAGGVLAKVLAAMSAGAVASVVQAMLSSVTEPIVNRVLVRRMAVKDAIAEITPSMILTFFQTTIATNLIKFPLFEAVSMFMSLLPDMTSTTRGLIVGFIFTTATLPITNFRYRMSIQTPVSEALKPGLLYQAYLPTVVRDMVYSIARNTLTAMLILKYSGLTTSSPKLLFAVVLGGCFISAPFNEIRGYLLQSAGKKLTFAEFFKPVNFVRSTTLGALNQAIALAVGYWLTPIVGGLVSSLRAAIF